jgi:hypothetical protein
LARDPGSACAFADGFQPLLRIGDLEETRQNPKFQSSVLHGFQETPAGWDSFRRYEAIRCNQKVEVGEAVTNDALEFSAAVQFAL